MEPRRSGRLTNHRWENPWDSRPARPIRFRNQRRSL